MFYQIFKNPTFKNSQERLKMLRVCTQALTAVLCPDVFGTRSSIEPSPKTTGRCPRHTRSLRTFAWSLVPSLRVLRPQGLTRARQDLQARSGEAEFGELAECGACWANSARGGIWVVFACGCRCSCSVHELLFHAFPRVNTQTESNRHDLEHPTRSRCLSRGVQPVASAASSNRFALKTCKSGGEDLESLIYNGGNMWKWLQVTELQHVRVPWLVLLSHCLEPCDCNIRAHAHLGRKEFEQYPDTTHGTGILTYIDPDFKHPWPDR